MGAPVAGLDLRRRGDELPALLLGPPQGGVGELLLDVRLPDLLDPLVRPVDRLPGPHRRLPGLPRGGDAGEVLPGELPVMRDLTQGTEPAGVVRLQPGAQLRVERPVADQVHRLAGECGLLLAVPGPGLLRPRAVRFVVLRGLFQTAAQFGDRPGLSVQPLGLLPDVLGQLGGLGRGLVGQRRALVVVALP